MPHLKHTAFPGVPRPHPLGSTCCLLQAPITHSLPLGSPVRVTERDTRHGHLAWTEATVHLVSLPPACSSAVCSPSRGHVFILKVILLKPSRVFPSPLEQGPKLYHGLGLFLDRSLPPPPYLVTIQPSTQTAPQAWRARLDLNQRPRTQARVCAAGGSQVLFADLMGRKGCGAGCRAQGRPMVTAFQ